MASSNSFLKKCEQLARAGYTPELEAGMIIGRGFADLGYEEFALLGGNKLISLYTGKAGLLTDGEKGHFFCVPSCDQLVDAITKRRFGIKTLRYADQRDWLLELEGNGAAIQTRAASLHEALVDGLAKIVEVR